jgi:diguanylate cyclase (GGDEF)-like protein
MSSAIDDQDDLIRRYEKRIYDLEQLLEISKSLNSTLDYDSLIQSILYICMGQMKVLRAGLFVRESPEKDELALHRIRIGFELDNSIRYAIPEHHELVHFFQKHFDVYTFDEIRTKTADRELLGMLESMEPVLLAPLKAHSAVNGLLVLSDHMDFGEFTASEKEFLKTSAIFAGMAVHNAFLYEVSTTDMMTGLKLRHFFLEKLRDYQSMHLETGLPLSLAMIDIDHFKDVNDSYGHLCGDHVIRAVTRIIRASIRQTDTAARIGGEEFVVMLPDTDLNAAQVLGERIRRSIEDTRISWGAAEVSVTVSVGVAQFLPERDLSTHSLIERSDEAMYRSKQAGRNRVSLSV